MAASYLSRFLRIFCLGVIFSGLFGSFSVAQEVSEKEGKCNIKVPYPEQENDEEILKVNYIIQFLSYKIERMPDFVLQQGEGAHAQFRIDKSCQEILQMIIEKL